MKKEFYWPLKVDGTRHEVTCNDLGNSFDVFVDGEFRFNVRSDINLDIEEDITVGSKRCRFVVYRGVPDLAVDGILMDAEANILKEERRNRNLTIVAGLFMIVMGIAAAWSWLAIYANGESHFGGFMGPVFATLVCFSGIGLILWTLRKRGH